MKSIVKQVRYELEINKSIFINYLIPVSSVEKVQNVLSLLREQYPDANHHCYAYILGDNQEIQKYDDDGEPHRTAGLPIIEVLKTHELTNILHVSIRYFGGIKLGAGGLVRAYTKGCAEAVKLSTFSYLTTLVHVTVTIPFDQIGHVEQFLRDGNFILETTYTNQVHYQIEIKKEDLDQFKVDLNNKTSGSVSFEVTKEYHKYQ